jgi:hypothetical protein
VSGPVSIAVSGGPLAAPVLSRVAAALAAAAGLDLDRLENARLVADALAAHGPARTPDGRVRVAFDEGSGALTMRVGPLVAGGAAVLLRECALPGVGPVLQRLADEVGVDAESGTGEFLVIRLEAADRRRARGRRREGARQRSARP